MGLVSRAEHGEMLSVMLQGPARDLPQRKQNWELHQTLPGLLVVGTHGCH